jgi:uncharacterized damage-inducible protein DinB
MATKAIQQETLSSKLINQWEQAGEKFLNLVEALPENKFDYKPADGMRTFAEVCRHVVFWNRYVTDTARKKKADDTANEVSKAELGTKVRIVNALKQSTRDASDALKEYHSELSVETSEMLMTFIEHTCEHYGQLVVYARLNGIVPPASRS